MSIKSIGSKLRTTQSLSDKLDCAPPPPPIPTHTHTHGKDYKPTGLEVDITNKNMCSEQSAYSAVEETQRAFGLLLMHHFLLKFVHYTACEHFPVNQNCSVSKDQPPPKNNNNKNNNNNNMTWISTDSCIYEHSHVFDGVINIMLSYPFALPTLLHFAYLHNHCVDVTWYSRSLG